MTTFLERVQERTFYVKGVPFYEYITNLKKNIEDATEYEPRDDDIILTSCPKTGGTWTQFIILLILNKGKGFPTVEDVSTLLGHGVNKIDDLKKPRFYRHHLPYHIMKKNCNSKVIYVYRNPEDTLISRHCFEQDLLFGPVDLEEFFEVYISPYLGYGCYFKHVKSFYDHKEDKNLLMVSYENLLHDTKNEVIRIAAFLGKEYEKCLKENPKVLDAILKKTSFENMKKNNLHIITSESIRNKVNFFRKGTAGDGKCKLTPEQLKRLREIAENVLANTDILNEWYN